MIAYLDVRPHVAGAIFALLPHGAAVLEQVRSPYHGCVRFKVLLPALEACDPAELN